MDFVFGFAWGSSACRVACSDGHWSGEWLRQGSSRSRLSPLFGKRLTPTDADLDSDQALDNWLMREAVTYSHTCGTCKMGSATDPMAVVD